MKKLYFLLLITVGISANAQVINFPDPNFKAALLTPPYAGATFQIDANQNGEIEQSEAFLVTNLYIQNKNISDLTGIEYFTNLLDLDATGNQITDVDLSGLNILWRVILDNNLITDFYFDIQEVVHSTSAHSPNMQVSLVNNPLQSFNLLNVNVTHHAEAFISELPTFFNITGPLFILDYNGSNAEEIALTIPNVTHFYVTNCPNVKRINIKNGTFTYFWGYELPLFEYLCTDEDSIEAYHENWDYGNQFPNVEVNSYCTFAPGGEVFEILGSTTLDANNNGCDGSDPQMPFSKYTINNGSMTRMVTANAAGDFYYPVPSGSYTLTPILENPAYFNMSTQSVSIAFPAQQSPQTQQFCMTPNGIHPDLEVIILPLTINRPGFDSRYKIVYKNKGNTILSGNVTFNFDNRTEYVSATVTPSAVSTTTVIWNFANLNPFEQREIEVVLNVNSPTETPAVNDGDILHHNAWIVSLSGTDETPEDNLQYINPAVINSFDPNDKVCLEGTNVGEETIGKYVHYMIRFENTGSANAQNIVVKDEIDLAKFDIASLIPLDASDAFYTRINGNKVEFIFENIQLPFDDANNDGYVAFKIKTKPMLTVGDSFSNAASIYFDYNHPIVTEPAVTNISVLKTQDFEFSDYLTVYPNPANDILNIQSKNNIQITSAEIYNMLGQLVIAVTDTNEISKIDVSNLTSGNYFIKIHSDKGTTNTKFAKK